MGRLIIASVRRRIYQTLEGPHALAGWWILHPLTTTTASVSPSVAVATSTKLGVLAKQSVQPVPFRAAVSVFYGGVPSPQYTALAT